MAAAGLSRWRAAWRDLRLLVRDPGAWSAARYARKNRMEYTALHPERWSEAGEGERPPTPTAKDDDGDSSR